MSGRQVLTGLFVAGLLVVGQFAAASSTGSRPAADEADSRDDLRAMVRQSGNVDLDRTMQRYETLRNHRALAVARSDKDFVHGLSHGQSSLSDAAKAALQQCDRMRTREQIAAACEIVRSNDVVVARGAVIRGRQGEHPVSLWRVRRDGRELWLAGSVHLLKETLYPLHPQVMQAWRNSDRLVLELHPEAFDAEDAQMMLWQRMVLPRGQTLADVLPQPLYRELRQWLQNAGGDIGDVEQFSPMWLATLMVLDLLGTWGYLEEHGLESLFVNRAQTEGRPVIGLETAEEQLVALLDHPLSIQIAALRTVMRPPQVQQDELAALIGSWWRGDSQAVRDLMAASEDDASRRFNMAVLDERNRRMAERIGQMLEDAEVEFVLVGTAHMAGETGIVGLLRKAGASVDQMRSNIEIVF